NSNPRAVFICVYELIERGLVVLACSGRTPSRRRMALASGMTAPQGSSTTPDTSKRGAGVCPRPAIDAIKARREHPARRSLVIFPWLVSHISIQFLLPARYDGACGGARRQFAAVYHPPADVYRLEAEPLLRDLDGHEAAGFVVAGGEKWGAAVQVAGARFAADTGDKILHALLWLAALVYMVVSRESRVHTVPDQYRLDLGSQPKVRPVSI